jgi:PKD repeat protein
MAMTCPPGAGASPQFAHQITAAAEPYSITINYGDGDAYVDTNAHLAAIFSHTYKAQGTYTVTAVLTDAAQATTTATCTYTW